MSTLLTMVHSFTCLLYWLWSRPSYRRLDFNPRSPRGERPKFGKDKSDAFIISIHALREESDLRICRASKYFITYFNPRSPRGERHLDLGDSYICEQFQSTLSARRATCQSAKRFWGGKNFNPRSPRGERRYNDNSCRNQHTFQSTLSARRATFFMIYDNMIKFTISIHALREESDLFFSSRVYFIWYFNPRSPRGERLP